MIDLSKIDPLDRQYWTMPMEELEAALEGSWVQACPTFHGKLTGIHSARMILSRGRDAVIPDSIRSHEKVKEAALYP